MNGTIKSSHVGILPFPDDVLRIICELAALEDQSTAYALALTSQKVCKWTAKSRWRTITITSPKQLISFWTIIHAIPDDISAEFWNLYHYTGGLEDEEFFQDKVRKAISKKLQKKVRNMMKSKDGRVKGISFPPGGYPHVYVKNLFIDIRSGCSQLGECWRLFYAICTDFCEMTSGDDLSESLFLDPLLVLQRWNDADRASLEVVSLGVLESLNFNLNCGPNLLIKELTIVCDEGMESLHFLPRTVERLHIIGESSESPLSGITPPWSLFKSLCTPYADQRYSLSSGSSRIRERELTHIRYDTRRFSFKPAEITAKRMGPLFRELTLTPLDSDQRLQQSAKEATASFQFDGPPHAAPFRGAGNLERLQSTTNLIPIHKLAQQGDPIAQYMCTIGIGQVALLQLAWEPMTGSEEMLKSVQPWYKKGQNHGSTVRMDDKNSNEETSKHHGMRDETGGWPRERRGAWTERSEKSNSVDSFAAELREAIESLWGWHGDEVEAAGRYCRKVEENGENKLAQNPYERNSAFSLNNDILSKDMIEGSPDLYQREWAEMQKVISLIRRDIPTCQLSHPKFASDDDNPLCFGIRAPRSLVHLGGKAAFSFHDRLRLFYDRAQGGKGAWP